MMKSKFYSLLSVIGSILFVGAVFAGESECSFDFKGANFVVSSCAKYDKELVVSLSPTNLSANANSFDKIPTVLVIGVNPEAALKKNDLQSAGSYNGLIELPDPEGIEHISDAPESAKIKLAGSGWKVLDMKVVEYEGVQGGEGFVFVCSTLKRINKKDAAVVAQCNSFYDEDIIELNALLKSLDG
ncbi:MULTISPECIES: hypothetical protein [unclassified Pseudomonas]|jgi:hypothetical protein|uniref:hypothetical protein n=1 Tax=unclassified Pseudomonas TaxID=196821 RepID=UPI0030D78F64